MSNSNASIIFNQDTLGAITSLTYLHGSGNQILDNVYNTANSLGLGGDLGASPDTIISWYTSATNDTNIFTYQNAGKYGQTGSKVVRVTTDSNGVTDSISLTLENSKSVTVATAWKPGGDIGGTTDNVVLANGSSATKTALTYPVSPALFGPDTITLSGMYDSRYSEYFGFKSTAPVVAADSQSSTMLKQSLSFSNSSGSNQTYNYAFAVRKSRLDYFDTWANDRFLFVNKPATGDTLTAKTNYIVWESFGASPASISFSADGGSTFGNAATIVGDTTSIDSAQYTMPSGPPNNNCVVEVKSSKNDVGKSGVFRLAAPYVSVSTPASGAIVSPGQSYVAWHNTTGAGVTGIQLSLDSGKTWIDSMAVSPPDSAAIDSVLFDFSSQKTASANSMVRLWTNASDTAKSATFTISGGGATFTIPTAMGSPNGQVVVTLRASDNVVGDSITSFDLKMNFDSTYVSFDSLTFAPLLQNPNWITAVVDTNTLTTDSNYVRLAAFMAVSGHGIKDSAIANLYFTVKNKQSIIGQVDSLLIKNSVLAASGNSATSLNVSGSSNGVLKIYSSITGHVHYMHEDTVAASYTISGDSVMVYRDITDSTNDAYFSVVGGQYDMTNRPPHDSVSIYPAASIYTSAGWSSIDVVDARLAFADFSNPLSTRAKIAADVNGDSVVNSTDAEMIMNIQVDSTYLKGLGLSNWVFVDSSNLAGVEHSADSLSQWWKADKHSIDTTLVNQQSNQDFFGVLRGDVNFSYASSQNVNTAKSMTKSLTTSPLMKTEGSSPAVFSTEGVIGVRPGDTLWLPLNINPGDAIIGGFDASLKVDPKLFEYTGHFKTGPIIPPNTNWYFAAHCDNNGFLKVAAIDFDLHIVPITESGTAALFEFVVNKDVKAGTSSSIIVQTQTVVDPNMHSVSSQGLNGNVQITSNGVAVPKEYGLSQNYPNPFNPSTKIQFNLPMDSKVDIVIYNVLGQKVATLVDGTVSAGYHSIEWNASSFSSGVYFSVIRCTSISNGRTFNSVKKLMLLK